jgi:hypothetical protein
MKVSADINKIENKTKVEEKNQHWKQNAVLWKGQYNWYTAIKTDQKGWVWWYMPIIPDTQEEIGGSGFKGILGKS